MIRPTHAIIQLDCYAHNLREIRKAIPAHTHIMAIVKANAYGHGILPMAQKALQSGASMLGVAIPEEGALLRENGIEAPILVLGGVLNESIPLVIRHQLQQTVFDAERLETLADAAKIADQTVQVHIKIDSGMNRVGVKQMQVFDKMLHLIKNHKHLQLAGLYTHFAKSDDADKTFTLRQLACFEKYVQRARQMGLQPLLHAANSGAVCDLPQTHLDIVRPGILTYGCYPSDSVKRDIAVKPVMRLVTRVMHVKSIEAGESVSYGCRFTAQRETRVASLPIGYGDGLHRFMTGKAQVLVGGRRASVIGTICMDQCMIDVTDIPGVGIGDEVVLIGRQGDEYITADELASWAQTISYEVLLSISSRVPRIYADE